MKKLFSVLFIFSFLFSIASAQNGNVTNLTQEVKKEAEKLKSGTEAVKQGKKKAGNMTKAQKDALKKKKKSVNAKNAKKELDKMLK